MNIINHIQLECCQQIRLGLKCIQNDAGCSITDQSWITLSSQCVEGKRVKMSQNVIYR